MADSGGRRRDAARQRRDRQRRDDDSLQAKGAPSVLKRKDDIVDDAQDVEEDADSPRANEDGPRGIEDMTEEEESRSPLIEKKSKPRTAPFIPPKDAVLPQKSAPDRGDEDGNAEEQLPGRDAGEVEDAEEGDSDEDEKDIERRALLKREGEEQKHSLLQYLPQLLRDDDFYPIEDPVRCCRCGLLCGSDDDERKWRWKAGGAFKCHAPAVLTRCCGCASKEEDDIENGLRKEEEEDEEDFDAGLFVAEQPYVTEDNIIRLEKRRRRDLKKWKDRQPAIDQESDVFQATRLPDPLSHLCARHVRWDDIDDTQLKVKYQQPVIPSDRMTLSRFVTGPSDGIASVDGSIINLKDRKHYLLTVELQRLIFDDHEFFSEEDYLAARLVEMYDQWKYGKQQHAISTLQARIEPLKEAIGKVSKKLEKEKARAFNRRPVDMDNSEVEEDLVLQNLTEKRRLCRELRTVRQAIRDEEGAERKIVADMVAKWNEIKRVRKASHLQRSVVKLRMQKRDINRAAEEDRFTRRAEEEMKEEQEQFAVEQEYKLHQCEVEIAKKQAEIAEEEAKAKVIQMRHRASQRDNRNDKVSFGTDEVPPERGTNTGGVNIDVLRQELTDKSNRLHSLKKKLRRGLNPERLTEKLRAQLASCEFQQVTVVGEDAESEVKDVELVPYLTLKGKPRALNDMVPISHALDEDSMKACPQKEQDDEKKRLKHIADWRMYARLVVNGHNVATTESVQCGPEFSLDFNASFGLKLVSWPDQVVVQLWREKYRIFGQSTGQDVMLGQVFVMIPGAHGVSRIGPAASMYRFYGDEVIANPWSQNVVKQRQSAQEGEVLAAEDRFHSGTLGLLAKWGGAIEYTKSGAEQMENEECDEDEDGLPDLPPRPANISGEGVDNHGIRIGGTVGEEVLDRVGEMDPNDPRNVQLLQEGSKPGDVMFRLRPEQGTLDCLGETDKKKRHKLAVKRWKTHRHTQLYLLEHQIHAELIREQVDDSTKEEIAGPRDKVKRFIEIIQRRSAQRRSAARRAYSVADVVREPRAIEFGASDMSWIMKYFQPRRKLKPVRQEIKPATSAAGEVELMVIIMRGYDFPVRNSGKDGEEGADVVETDEAESSMTSIEVRFQATQVCTRPVAGADPQWNETLFLNLETENRRYVPKDLEQVTDVIHISVFDEMVAKEEREGAERARNYLGSVKIPFQHVYMNGKVEGVYEVETPLLNIAYKEDVSNKKWNRENEMSKPMLKMYIAMNPRLSAPDVKYVEGLLPSQADPEFAVYCQKFLRLAKAKSYCSCQEDIQVAVPDLGGRSIFLTSFVVPLQPPETFNENEYAMLRLVSMVPYIEDWVAFDGGYDVWCTSTEFLDLCAGDADEHAVLLCSYFLGAASITSMKDAWVVVGRADPEGSTTWVLSRDNDGKERLWDPNRGRVFEIGGSDRSCPFKEVVMLFNDKGVYVNIQKQLNPGSVSFEVEDQRKWLPFFNDKIPAERRPIPVQEARLEYPPVSWDDADTIEQNVKQEIRNNVEAVWPYDAPPRWIKIDLKSLLLDLERFKKFGNPKPDLSPELDKMQRSYVIRGFPINCTYLDTDSIVNEVLDTGIHRNVEMHTNFGLEVYVCPYVQGVYSVWIYFTSLTQRNMR